MGAPFVSAVGEGSPPRQNLSDFVIDVLGQLRENVLNVAGEVLFEIKHLEGGEDLLRSVRDGSQLELIERDVAVAQVILDYRAQVVYLHAPSVWEMQCRENGVVSTIETHLDFVVITRGDHDVGNLRGTNRENESSGKTCFDNAEYGRFWA